MIQQQYIGQQDTDGLLGVSNRTIDVIASQGPAHEGGQPNRETVCRHEGNGLYGKGNVAGCELLFAQSADHEDKKGKSEHIHGELQCSRNTGLERLSPVKVRGHP
jgi:hypothetical protein